jgi:membrane fusion protein, multidrug efflux system
VTERGPIFSMTLFRRALCVAGASSVLWLSGCGGTDAKAETTDGPKKGADGGAKKGGANAQGKSAGAMQRRSFNVRTATVTTQPLTYMIRATGNVEATDIYRIDSRVAGTIYDVKFNEGDKVSVDDVLCTIAPHAYKFRMQKQEALHKEAIAAVADMKRKKANEIERKRIDLDRASLEVARRIAVREAGAISNEEIQLYESRRDLAQLELKDAREAAETEIKALEAKVLETEADFKIAEDDVRKSVVKSPIAGTIEKRSVTNGMFVQTGLQLATIIDRSQMRVRFKVSESESAALKVGDVVTFNTPAYPGREFSAKIYYVGGKLEDDARVVLVHANVEKDAELLKPGYFAAVSLVASRNEKAIVVPLLAVQPTERGFTAFVVKNGKAERRLVKTGMAVTERDIEVVEGLKEGEILVVDGANALQEGTPVKVLEGPGAEAKDKPAETAQK